MEQLDLITIRLTPDEAKRVLTCLGLRWSLLEEKGAPTRASYRLLYDKVYEQVIGRKG